MKQMKMRGGAVFAVSLLILVSSTALRRATGGADRNPQAFRKIAVVTSHVRITGHGETNSGLSDGTERFEMEFTGVLRREAFGRPDGSRCVVFSVLNPAYRLCVNGVPNAPAAEQATHGLSQAFIVETDSGGCVTAIRTPELPSVARGIARTLALSTQTAPARPEVERIEADPDLFPGAMAQVRYKATSTGMVARSRQILLPSRRKWGRDEKATEVTASFADTGAFHSEHKGLFAGNGEVLLSATLRQGSQFISKMNTRVCLSDTVEEKIPLGEVTSNNPLSRMSAPVDLLVGDDYAGAEAKIYANTLAGDNFDVLRERTLSVHVREDAIGLDRKWRSLLLLNPRDWDRFRTFALSVRGIAIDSLGSALMQVGTPAAQALLWEMYDIGHGANDTDFLVNFAAGVETPTIETVKRLTALAEQDDPEGYRAAVALGILARQWSDDAPHAARGLVARLEAQARDTTRSSDYREAAWMGIGNSACKDALNSITSALRVRQPKPVDAGVLSAAVSATRDFDSTAIEPLLRRLGDYPLAAVRDAAQSTLQYRGRGRVAQ